MIQNKFYKKLYRSRKERVIAGVCGGLAEYFTIDPTWIRLLFIILFLLGGCSFIIYILMWIIIPKSPKDGFSHP